MVYSFSCAHSGGYHWCDMCSIMERKTPPKCYVTRGKMERQLMLRKKYSRKVFRKRYGPKL